MYAYHSKEYELILSHFQRILPGQPSTDTLKRISDMFTSALKKYPIGPKGFSNFSLNNGEVLRICFYVGFSLSQSLD